MKNKLCLLLMLLSIQHLKAQTTNIYLCKDGEASFFSETPVENIEAQSLLLNTIINTNTNEISYLIAMSSFKFKKPLMQEHFNEKYIESNKFPYGTFKGKINDSIDWKTPGVYNVTSTGILTIHGIPQNRTEKGIITIGEGSIKIEGTFIVKLADHNISIPKIVIKNIAEEVSVKHKCILIPYTAKTK